MIIIKENIEKLTDGIREIKTAIFRAANLDSESFDN